MQASTTAYSLTRATLIAMLIAVSGCGSIPVKTGMVDAKVIQAKAEMRQQGALLVIQPCIKANVFGDNYILKQETANAAQYLSTAVTNYMATEGITVKKTLVSAICNLNSGSNAVIAQQMGDKPRTLNITELYGETNRAAIEYIPSVQTLDCMRGTIGAWASDCRQPLTAPQAAALMKLAGANHVIYVRLIGRVNSTAKNITHFLNSRSGSSGQHVLRSIIDLKQRRAIWVPLKAMDSATIGDVTERSRYSQQWAMRAFQSFFNF